MEQGYGKCRHGVVFGNLAFDFLPEEGEESYARLRESPAAETPARRRRPALWLALAAGCAAALLVLTAALLGRVRLTALAARVSAAEQTVAVLRTEQRALRLRYEQTFPLEEIEAVATTELGMQRPRSDQIRRVSAASPDRATVLAQNGGDGLPGALGAAVDSIAACFHP